MLDMDPYWPFVLLIYESLVFTVEEIPLLFSSHLVTNKSKSQVKKMSTLKEPFFTEYLDFLATFSLKNHNLHIRISKLS